MWRAASRGPWGRRPRFDACLASAIRPAPFRNLQSSSLGDRPQIGFCFDIDGVLKRGAKILPEGRDALRILSGENSLGRRYPFVLVTNGGGIDETTRCQNLSRELDARISAKQLIQSHTIFRRLQPLYADKPILVIGGAKDRCRRIAEGYGFREVYQPADLLAWNPSLWPFHRLTSEEQAYSKVADFSSIGFRAVLVMHDPEDWGLSTQVICDLVSAGGSLTRRDSSPGQPQIPVYFSNPDFVWANDWERPRFGQGAFQECLRANYLRLTGSQLEATTSGKPSRATFEFADALLRAEAGKLTNGSPETSGKLDALGDPLQSLAKDRPPLDKVYMIGDNPSSDIAGANAYGWDSLLVRTGVFRGPGENHHEHPATKTFDTVLDAVKWAVAGADQPRPRHQRH